MRARGHKKKLVALALVFVGVGAQWNASRASPLPVPPPFDGALPAASPPADMTMVRIDTGVTHRSAAFAYRGGSWFDDRDFAMTAVLVKHPRGDVLIDTGFGKAVGEQLGLMPFWFRWTTSFSRTRSVAERFDEIGYDRSSLRAVLLTHAHWDHASGLGELGATPVWVTAEEHRFVGDGGFLTAVARSAKNAKWEEYTFEGGTYLGFPKSHDVWGDGSIVVVPCPGHTPGSVVVFVTLPSEKRFVFVGDLVWQREGISEREERPWFQRTFGDSDAAEVRENILRVAALAARFPELVIVPAHDARAFREIPEMAK